MKGVSPALALGLFVHGSATAQWPDQPRAGVPRLENGQVNLSAPAPRLADGTPDLSGIWVLRPTVDPGLIGLPYGPEFGNIGSSLADGLPYQAWAAGRFAQQRENSRAQDPLSHCLPIGPIRIHTIPFYRELVQLPDRILLLSEYNQTYRPLFTDGRPLPKDPVPTLTGYSAGHWDGDTLVIETQGFRDASVWLDALGSPLTDAAKLTERFRRVSFGELRIELTVDDSKAYTSPWTVTLVQELRPDLELNEAFCAEEALRALDASAAREAALRAEP